MSLKTLLCCLPAVCVPPEISYRNIFRIIIMQFLDAWNFDVRSVKKTCVHISSTPTGESFHSTLTTCSIAMARKRNWNR